ncbi:hypothetical protein ABZ863_11670 [Saccharomonospora sp. NPDC046836]|uniref:hypothetical protein n=1 Tax=Saccharomonospora sp. NPDC046836 TaxID=3156921 RepID=UPI00340D79C4
MRKAVWHAACESCHRPLPGQPFRSLLDLLLVATRLSWAVDLRQLQLACPLCYRIATWWPEHRGLV